MSIRYKSQVQSFPADDSTMAQDFFTQKLLYETDPADVYFDLSHDVANFVLVDVRSEADYARGHILNAINIPHAEITEARIKEQFPPDTLFVTYCTGLDCNGSTKGALRFSQLGYAVKEMIGGFASWQKEGYPIKRGSDS